MISRENLRNLSSLHEEINRVSIGPNREAWLSASIDILNILCSRISLMKDNYPFESTDVSWIENKFLKRTSFPFCRLTPCHKCPLKYRSNCLIKSLNASIRAGWTWPIVKNSRKASERLTKILHSEFGKPRKKRRDAILDLSDDWWAVPPAFNITDQTRLGSSPNSDNTVHGFTRCVTDLLIANDCIEPTDKLDALKRSYNILYDVLNLFVSWKAELEFLGRDPNDCMIGLWPTKIELPMCKYLKSNYLDFRCEGCPMGEGAMDASGNVYSTCNPEMLAVFDSGSPMLSKMEAFRYNMVPLHRYIRKTMSETQEVL